MAVTRKLLKGMGLTEEQQDTIIEEHTNTVNALKDEVDQYKAEAEKVADLQRQLEEANTKLEADSGDADDWKSKYDNLQTEFNSYKDAQQKKETHSAKEKAYRDLLLEAGVNEKHVDAIMKVSDVDDVKLDEDGKAADADALKDSIKTEWSDFITTTEVKGANTPNPPTTVKGTKEAYDAMSLADKMKYANEHPQDVEKWANE